MLKNQVVTPGNLEVQMGQLATELKNMPQGDLPNDMVNSRKNKEQCKAMTLESGKVFEGVTPAKRDEVVKPSSIQTEEIKVAPKIEKEEEKNEGVDDAATLKEQFAAWKHYISPPPFPQRLQKHKEKVQHMKFPSGEKGRSMIDVLDALVEETKLEDCEQIEHAEDYVEASELEQIVNYNRIIFEPLQLNKKGSSRCLHLSLN